MVRELLLRCTRAAKHCPYFRGRGALKYLDVLYRFVPPEKEWRLRVSDFDGDLKMDVDVRDSIGRSIWYGPRYFEQFERKLFCQSVTHGCAVLDIGANIGIYTLLAAKRGARVFAIEADPENVEALRRHVHLNGFDDRVIIFHMAATDKSGSRTLFHDRKNSGHSNLFAGVDPVSIPGNTIDSLELPSIDICKMDVEGAELEALSGMDETIRRSPNMKMLMEYAKLHARTDGLMDFIFARFSSVSVVNRSAEYSIRRGQEPPPYCNLWISGSRK